MTYPTWWLNTWLVFILGYIWLAAQAQMLFDTLPLWIRTAVLILTVLVLIARRQERKNPPVRDTGGVESSSP